MDQPVQPADMERIIAEHGDMLFRICFIMLCSEPDVEDVLQDTFFRYLKKTPLFNSEEHEKAWLIKVATNRCRDMLRFRFKQRNMDPNLIQSYCGSNEQAEVLELFSGLPAKYKPVLHLFYVEKYRTKEIAEILGISVDAVKKRLQRGRQMLRKAYEEG